VFILSRNGGKNRSEIAGHFSGPVVDEQLVAAGRANGDGIQRHMGDFGAAVPARIFRRHYPGGGPGAAKGGSDSRVDEERTAATRKFLPDGIIASGPARYA
jgi:hypothetical protein